MLLVVIGLLLSLVLFWQRRSPERMVWLSSVLCMVGCGGAVEVADVPIPQDRIRELCWQPSEAPNAEFFYFPDSSGEASSVENRFQVEKALADHGFVFTYSESAPVGNLRLLPMSRSDAWCTAIPKPTDPNVLQLLSPCIAPAVVQRDRVAAGNLLGQTEPSVRSTLFCGQMPQMAPTPQTWSSLLARNIAYQSAYEYARKTANALTKAEAEMQAVINKSDGWLKRQLTTDPGSIEQIQQRLVDALDSIEAPPEYDDRVLEILAIAGLKAGFDDGKFEVEAKLFAIDAGVFLLEVALLEAALGPLGGAKLIVSAVGKGAKAVTTVASKAEPLLQFASTKGGQAFAGAMKRLENLPIFLPIATGATGATVRLGALTGSMSARVHRYLLEKALRLSKDPLVHRIRQTGESLHHIVAHGDARAALARDILKKFKIDIDAAWNGVFLPATKLSPNPTGAIVHSVVHSDKYYRQVENLLDNAKNQKDAIRILQNIRKALENGTFFDAPL